MFGDVFIAKITANIVANGISLDNLGGKHVPVHGDGASRALLKRRHNFPSQFSKTGFDQPARETDIHQPVDV
jgi:hypothetical protein